MPPLPAPIPDQVVEAKGKGKGCLIDHTYYYVNLKDEDKEHILTVIRYETARHYSTHGE